MQFKEYPSYKNSGVEWLGDVPSDWEQKPIWSLFKRVKRTNQPDERLLSVYRDYGVIPKDSRDDNHNRASEDLTPYQLVRPNDLVINKMKAWQGSIAISEIQGIVSPAYYIYTPKKDYHSKYIYFLIRSAYYIQSYKNYSKGIRVNQWDLESESFIHINLLLPTINEQQKIVSFLDQETQKIDTLIAKQEKLIELLEEQRKSVISHAVTKGLDPNAPMKDSGVEWLGDVPSHWEVVKLRWITKGINTGGTPSIYLPTVDYDADYIDWFTPSDFKGDFHLRNSQKKVNPQAVVGNDLKIIPENSLLLIGIGATLGKVGYITDKASSNQQINYLLPNKNKAELIFLIYYLFACNQYVKNMASASTLAILNQQKMGDILVSLPNLPDQKKIVDFLEFENVKFNDLISKQQALIEKLKEYRASIISHAVTGKIDVRELVA
ncbi:restriction endonuclease subunit S [Enterobacter soli]|uniref:restriction endonuclease subunit S n=1 Tax=Enterobacter soli TaxID=885040 RepID=UPI0021473930|nr:restriction endonuclease subunit S [Enterobacter soli]MCR1319140.1 restriction endonuclease subunit S [Enterobacter soli]